MNVPPETLPTPGDMQIITSGRSKFPNGPGSLRLTHNARSECSSPVKINASSMPIVEQGKRSRFGFWSPDKCNRKRERKEYDGLTFASLLHGKMPWYLKKKNLTCLWEDRTVQWLTSIKRQMPYARYWTVRDHLVLMALSVQWWGMMVSMHHVDAAWIFLQMTRVCCVRRLVSPLSPWSTHITARR